MQKQFNSEKFGVHRLVYGENTPEHNLIQVADAETALTNAVIASGANPSDVKAFKALQKAEDRLASAKKLLTTDDKAEKKERSPKECVRITKNYINGAESGKTVTEAGLTLYILGKNVSLDDPENARQFVEKLKAKQRELGLKDDDGIFGPDTYNAIVREGKGGKSILSQSVEKKAETGNKEFTDAEKTTANIKLAAIAKKLSDSYKENGTILKEIADKLGRGGSLNEADKEAAMQAYIKLDSAKIQAISEAKALAGDLKQFKDLPKDLSVQLGLGIDTAKTIKVSTNDYLANDLVAQVFGTDGQQNMDKIYSAFGPRVLVETAHADARKMAEAKQTAEAEYKKQVEEWAQKIAGDQTAGLEVANLIERYEETPPPFLEITHKNTTTFMADIEAKRQEIARTKPQGGQQHLST